MGPIGCAASPPPSHETAGAHRRDRVPERPRPHWSVAGQQNTGDALRDIGEGMRKCRNVAYTRSMIRRYRAGNVWRTACRSDPTDGYHERRRWQGPARVRAHVEPQTPRVRLITAGAQVGLRKFICAIAGSLRDSAPTHLPRTPSSAVLLLSTTTARAPDPGLRGSIMDGLRQAS